MVSLTFSASSGDRHFVGSWSCHSDVCFCRPSSFSDCGPVPPFYKDPCDDTEPTWIAGGPPPHLKVLNLDTSAKSLLLHKVRNTLTGSEHAGVDAFGVGARSLLCLPDSCYGKCSKGPSDSRRGDASWTWTARGNSLRVLTLCSWVSPWWTPNTILFPSLPPSSFLVISIHIETPSCSLFWILPSWLLGSALSQ